MILHELQDNPDIMGIVLDTDDPHDVGGVLGVRVLAVFVGQQQTGATLAHLSLDLYVLLNYFKDM